MSADLVSNDSVTITAHQGGGKHQGGGHHDGHHGDHPIYIPPPTYDSWYYDWEKPPAYSPPPISPHPYQPETHYRPLYPDDQLQPTAPAYPETSIYLPTFTLSTDTPLVRIGSEIRVTASVEKGAPPYTVFWQYGDNPEWISGTTTFSHKAEKKGVLVITAIVKDLNEQISLPQKIEIIVFGSGGE